MPTLTIPINISNESLQIGDAVYYARSSTSLGSFETTSNTSDIVLIGNCTAINNGSIEVNASALIPMPSNGDYVFFEKNRQINSNSVLGYYAEAKFVNNSNKKSELFSVASDVSESSK